MAVYIDRARNPHRGMKMCHMLADTERELADMARALDLSLAHFQTGPVPHFDICQRNRARARALGALEIDRRETAWIVRRLKADLSGFRGYPDPALAWRRDGAAPAAVRARLNEIAHQHADLETDRPEVLALALARRSRLPLMAALPSGDGPPIHAWVRWDGTHALDLSGVTPLQERLPAHARPEPVKPDALIERARGREPDWLAVETEVTAVLDLADEILEIARLTG